MSEQQPLASAGSMEPPPHRPSVRVTRGRRSSHVPVDNRALPGRGQRGRVELEMDEPLVDLLLELGVFSPANTNIHRVLWEQVAQGMRELNARIKTPQGLKLRWLMLKRGARRGDESMPEPLRQKVLRCMEMANTDLHDAISPNSNEQATARAIRIEDDQGLPPTDHHTPLEQQHDHPSDANAVVRLQQRALGLLHEENMAYLENQRLIYGAILRDERRGERPSETNIQKDRGS